MAPDLVSAPALPENDYAKEKLLPLWLKLQNGTGEKMVINDQKQASCPSQPQGMGTCPPLSPGSEG